MGTGMGEDFIVRKALIEAGEYLAKQKNYEKKKAAGKEVYMFYFFNLLLVLVEEVSEGK